MRVPSLVRGGSVGFNMTPMIDVVFQLIIFFLVSSHLAKQEARLELPLPTAQSGVLDISDETPRLIVNVQADGGLLLAGHRVDSSGLREGLRSRRAKDGDALEVVVRTARDASYRHVQPVLVACAAEGLWRVTFAVYHPEDVR